MQRRNEKRCSVLTFLDAHKVTETVVLLLLTHSIILSLICSGNTNLFAGCPTEVTITSSTGNYEEGAVLTCNADGYLPSYTWTGAAGVNRDFVMVQGSSTYTLPEGEFDLICTATVGELSCCASAVVSDRAERKYQKQQKQCHNLVTLLMVMTPCVGSTVIASDTNFDNTRVLHKTLFRAL